MDLSLLYLAAIVFAAYAAQTAAGFGAVLISLTLGAQVFAIPRLLLVVVPLSLVQCGYVAVRHRGAIDWRLLGGRILPFMGIGVIAGLSLAPHIGGNWLRLIFGALVLLLSLCEIAALFGPRAGEPRAILGEGPLAVLLVGAGIMHGVYAIGGPLLVYAADRSGMSKAAFRSTITVVWIPLNVILAASYLYNGAYDGAALHDLGIAALGLPLGILLGERIHHRIDPRRFRLVVFTLLAGAAVALLAR